MPLAALVELGPGTVMHVSSGVASCREGMNRLSVLLSEVEGEEERWECACLVRRDFFTVRRLDMMGLLLSYEVVMVVVL